MKTLAASIASKVQAIANCKRTGNAEWLEKHTQAAHALAEKAGLTLKIDESRVDRLVFHASQYVCNEDGYHEGYATFRVAVTPTFEGVRVALPVMTSGPRLGYEYKDLVHEQHAFALTMPVSPAQEAKAYGVEP